MKKYRKINTTAITVSFFLNLAYAVYSDPPDAEYKLIYAEEFNGKELNLNDWKYRKGQRFDGLNLPGNVSVENGNLIIKFKKETVKGKKRYTCGGIISKNMFGYGYYETRSKLFGKGPGLHSSFWTMGTKGDGVNTPLFNQVIEIDGYEVNSSAPSLIKPNLHFYIGNHTATGPRIINNPKVNSSKDYFICGYEWLPNRMRYYLNGKLFMDVKNPQYYAQQQFWLTALAMPKIFKIDDTTLPGESKWDYFRYYRCDLKGVNIIGNPGFEYNTAKKFIKKNNRISQPPVAWIEAGDNDASFVYETPEAIQGKFILRHYLKKPYSVETYQVLDFIMNGKYDFQTQVRNQHNLSRIIISGYGGKDIVIDIPETKGRRWQKISYKDIKIKTNKIKIAFASKSKGGGGLDVDEVKLFQTTGKIQAKHWGKYPKKHQRKTPYISEVYTNIHSDSNFTAKGKWTKSLLSGAYNQRTAYSQEPGAFAQWTLVAPARNEYAIEVYNTVHKNSNRKTKIVIELPNMKKAFHINQGSGGGRWEPLGNYQLNKGDKVKVTLSGSGKFIRADSIRIYPVISTAVNKCIFFKTGKNIYLDKGEKKRLASDSPDAVCINTKGNLYIPLVTAGVILNCDVYSDEKGKKISLSGGGVEYKTKMTKDSKQFGKFYIPAKDVFASRGYILTAYPDGLFCLSKQKYFDDKKDKYILKEINRKLSHN